MRWFKDTAERVARTAVQAWLGWWIALSGHDFDDLFGHDALLTGFAAGAVALLTCLGASQVNGQGTASFQKQPPKDSEPAKKPAKKTTAKKKAAPRKALP